MARKTKGAEAARDTYNKLIYPSAKEHMWVILGTKSKNYQ